MEQKTQFKLVFYGILGSMFFFILLNYQTVHWEDMFVAVGTVILALFTWKLALTETEESKQTRKIMIREARMERKRLRLKEQLEGLYSPLMAQIDNFDWTKSRSQHLREIGTLMVEKKGKYEFLANPKLRELLITYYHPDARTMATQEWSDFIRDVGQTIADDFKRLTEEYNDLTKSIE